jgi:hypothetical protein
MNENQVRNQCRIKERKVNTWSSRNDWDIGFDGRLPCSYFIAHLVDNARRRANKTDATVDASLCEICPFGEETVARVDGVDSVFFGDTDDFRNGQIRSNWSQTFANQVRFICLLPVHLHLVLL